MLSTDMAVRRSGSTFGAGIFAIFTGLTPSVNSAAFSLGMTAITALILATKPRNGPAAVAIGICHDGLR